MASRKEQVLWESVRGIADELASVYSLVGMLSAGLLMFSRLSPEEREQAIRDARLFEDANRIVDDASDDAAKHRKKQGQRPAKHA